MASKTNEIQISKYKDNHFFRKLLLTNPLIVTQKYSLSSFLAGQLMYRKLKNNYDAKEIMAVTASNRDDFFYGDNKKILTGKDLFIVEPWFSLEEIIKVARFAKNVFFASSFSSHHEEVKKYHRYLPDNLHIFLSSSEELVVPIYKTYFDEFIKPAQLVQWLDVLSCQNVLSYHKAILENNATSHEIFYQMFESLDNLIPLNEGYDGADFDAAMMEFMCESIINESFTVYSRKQDLNILYMVTKLNETTNYDVFLRKAVGSESPDNLRNINVIVTFTITSTMVFYTVSRVDGDTDVLQVFSKHHPIGNEHRAIIVKPLSVMNSGITLKI